MKIALINPPQIFSQYQVATGIVPPLGLAYLASFCIKEGIEITLIDAVGEKPNHVVPFKEGIFLRGVDIGEIVERITDDTKLIGISNLFSFAFPAVRELVAALKATHPETPIVLGGPHPTHLVEYTLKTCKADYVILGEGEIPLVQLCRYIEGKVELSEVASLAYADANGVIVKTKAFPRIKDLDSVSVPFPARHLLPMENYIGAQEAHGSVGGRWTTILSSRGCPYGCTFCDSRRTKFVARSPKDVVDEMEFCYNEFGITEFHFEDDNMTLSRDRTISLCEEILARGLKIKWQTPNGIRASVTDEAMLRKMKESGCQHITLAPESGSERVLTEIIQKGKDFSLDQLLEVGRTAHRLGMKCAVYFILGLPGEKVEDIDLTIKYANKLARAGIDEAGFGLFIPLPGTPLWDEVVAKYGQPDFLDLLVIGDLNKAVSWSEFITDKQLDAYRRKALVMFQLNRMIFHPLRFSKTILNILRGVAETKTESYMRTFIKRAKGGPTEERVGGNYVAGSYTAYDNERTIGVLFKTVAHYGFSNSALRALLTVFMDFTTWLKGKNMGRTNQSR